MTTPVLEDALPALRKQLVAVAAARVQDRDLAEDIAQETLARLISNRTEFKSTEHLTGWAVTTTKNLCTDHFRKHGRVVEVEDMEPFGGFAGAADEGALSRDLVSSILEALSEMSERQAKVMMAALELGDSRKHIEIAAMTGESVKSVANFVDRARTLMKAKLEAAGQGAFALLPLPLRDFLRNNATARKTAVGGLAIPALALGGALLLAPYLPFFQGPQHIEGSEGGNSGTIQVTDVPTVARTLSDRHVTNSHRGAEPRPTSSAKPKLIDATDVLPCSKNSPVKNASCAPGPKGAFIHLFDLPENPVVHKQLGVTYTAYDCEGWLDNPILRCTPGGADRPDPPDGSVP